MTIYYSPYGAVSLIDGHAAWRRRLRDKFVLPPYATERDMPIFKDNSIHKARPLGTGSFWNALIAASDAIDTRLVVGDRVQTRSGGAEMLVVESSSSEARCLLGEHEYVLPNSILRRTMQLTSDTDVRRGRKVGECKDSSPQAISGDTFSLADLTRMREQYADADRRLGLSANPALARDVAVEILRVFVKAA